MTDPAQERLATLQRLERLIKQGERLDLESLQLPRIAAEDYAAVVSHYRGWYAACLALLPEDLRPAFRDAYSDTPFHPRLETYLAHARDPAPRSEQRSSPWKHPFDYRFHQLVSEQRRVLSAFRERLLKGMSGIPQELKDLVAGIFSGREHSVLIIDGLFTQAGARREWWVKPVEVTGKKRDRVRGWLAGIAIHAPDRELPIVEAVCRAVVEDGLASQATATRLAALLQTLGPRPAVDPAPPESRLYVAPELLEELRRLDVPAFDLSRLVRLCEELNLAMQQNMFFAAALLTRALIDHVPPIFGAASFKDLVAATRDGPFKDAMRQLDVAVSTIAGAYLHPHIRPREVLPGWPQLNVGPLLDLLLGETARVLKQAAGSPRVP